MADPVKVAKVCHEANRAYCSTIGDHSHKPWDEAPEWQRQSAIDGVITKLGNPDLTPEQSHENWMKHKHAQGWVYGPTKNEEHKTHPAMMKYSELPPTQRVKDYIFTAIVAAFLAAEQG